MVNDGLRESPYEKMVLVDDVDVTSDTMWVGLNHDVIIFEKSVIKSLKDHLEISYVCSVFFGEVTNLKYEMSRSHYIQIFCVCVWTFWKEQTIFKITKKPTTVYKYANLLDN